MINLASEVIAKVIESFLDAFPPFSLLFHLTACAGENANFKAWWKVFFPFFPFYAEALRSVGSPTPSHDIHFPSFSRICLVRNSAFERRVSYFRVINKLCTSQLGSALLLIVNIGKEIREAKKSDEI